MPPYAVRRRLILIYLAAVAAFAGPAHAQERWVTYSNARFGTMADYPLHLFTQRDPPPDNSDGQTFRTADGRARLSIYGAYNIESETPQQYVDRLVDLKGAEVALKRVTARFYVISGTRDGRIFYDRCNFPVQRDGVIDCFSLSYPAADKAMWDKVVARLSQSLRNAQSAKRR